MPVQAFIRSEINGRRSRRIVRPSELTHCSFTCCSRKLEAWTLELLVAVKPARKLDVDRGTFRFLLCGRCRSPAHLRNTAPGIRSRTYTWQEGPSGLFGAKMAFATVPLLLRTFPLLGTTSSLNRLAAVPCAVCDERTPSTMCKLVGPLASTTTCFGAQVPFAFPHYA